MKHRTGFITDLIRRLVIGLFFIAGSSGLAQQDSLIAGQFKNLDRSASWQLLDQVTLQFETYHPQGLTRAGDYFFLSSVQVLEPTRRLPTANPDRTAGRGVGHLFKFMPDGQLVASIQIGDGARYHPGGIDFDGEWIWVSVAEYRPNSHSLVYRVNPDTLETEQVFEFADHLGAIIHDRESETLVAASWGSRLFYKWEQSSSGYVDPMVRRNPGHYVDLQDCQSLPSQQMLCSGIAGIRSRGGAASALGGLELFDLTTLGSVHQLPVTEFTDTDTLLTRNPVYLSSDVSGLLLYAAPEDNPSRLFTYRISPAE